MDYLLLIITVAVMLIYKKIEAIRGGIEEEFRGRRRLRYWRSGDGLEVDFQEMECQQEGFKQRLRRNPEGRWWYLRGYGNNPSWEEMFYSTLETAYQRYIHS